MVTDQRAPDYIMTTSGTMTVIVCDDHLVFAESLAAVFEARGHHIVTCVTHPSDAIDAARELGAQVCALDLEYPDADGIEATADLVAAVPDIKVIVLSGYLDADRIAIAEAAGASACAVKNCDLGELVDLAEDLAAGRPTARVLGRPLASPSTSLDDPWKRDPQARFLTDREREVLQGLARGDSTQALAASLGVSVATIRTHIQSLLSKLGVHSRVEAVSFAASRGLLGPLLGSQGQVGA
jgi:two-component system nitrate/nitrite response regulator NarL